MKKKRKWHGAFLLSTALLFIGIALFFTLISFIPQYKIEGPETFYRFETAGVTGSYACLFIGFIFFLKDRRNGWPLLLAGSFFTLNGFLNLFLIKNKYIQPLTEFVGSLNQVATFTGSFVVLLVLLVLTGLVNKRNVTFAKSYWQGCAFLSQANFRYIFKNKFLKIYIEWKAWYNPQFDNVSDRLSEIDKANIQLIK